MHIVSETILVKGQSLFSWKTSKTTYLFPAVWVEKSADDILKYLFIYLFIYFFRK